MGALRTLSKRARISATSFTNHYKWGNFQGASNRLIGCSRLDPFRRGCDLAEVVELGEYLVLDCNSERKFGSVAISMLLVAYPSAGRRARSGLSCCGRPAGHGPKALACLCRRAHRVDEQQERQRSGTQTRLGSQMRGGIFLPHVVLPGR